MIEKQDGQELNMSEDVAIDAIKGDYTYTKEQLNHYMKMMSRHKPGNEEQKAKTKVSTRKLNKNQKASRKANRKGRK